MLIFDDLIEIHRPTRIRGTLTKSKIRVIMFSLRFSTISDRAEFLILIPKKLTSVKKKTNKKPLTMLKPNDERILINAPKMIMNSKLYTMAIEKLAAEPAWADRL